MGITNHGFRFLLSRSGIDFSRTVMIGHQQLFLDESDLTNVGLAGVAPTGFADELFRRLGAEQVDSIDASDYEQATIVHDMNTPIPEALRQQYTAVLDGGSLEHIFNFPVALANCMNLVRPGGHLLLITPGSNQLGHGLYQFSPELFFRALSPAYGFGGTQILIKDSRRGSGAWLEVQDPAKAGGRAELLSPRPLYLYVQAQRVGADAVDFSTPPQQSDYVTEWHGQGKPRAAPVGTSRGAAALAGSLKRISRRYDPLAGILARRRPDGRYFKQVELETQRRRD